VLNPQHPSFDFCAVLQYTGLDVKDFKMNV
jgi:hypothetical protein